MANSVDPDKTPHSAASDLGLHCLKRPICPNTNGYYGILVPWSWRQRDIYGKRSKLTSTMCTILTESSHGFGAHLKVESTQNMA